LAQNVLTSEKIVRNLAVNLYFLNLATEQPSFFSKDGIFEDVIIQK